MPRDNADETSAFDETITTLLTMMPDAGVVLRGDGSISAVNQALCDLFSYEANEMIGHSIEMLVPERFRELHRNQRSAYQGAPQARPMGAGLMLSGRRKDGTEFPIDVSLGPVVSGQRRVVIAAVRDTTDRHLNEMVVAKQIGHAIDKVADLTMRVTVVEEINDRLKGLDAGVASAKGSGRTAKIAAIVAVSVALVMGGISGVVIWRVKVAQCESLNKSNKSTSDFALSLFPVVSTPPGPDASPADLAQYQGAITFRQSALALGAPKNC